LKSLLDPDWTRIGPRFGFSIGLNRDPQRGMTDNQRCEQGYGGFPMVFQSLNLDSRASFLIATIWIIRASRQTGNVYVQVVEESSVMRALTLTSSRWSMAGHPRWRVSDCGAECHEAARLMKNAQSSDRNSTKFLETKLLTKNRHCHFVQRCAANMSRSAAKKESQRVDRITSSFVAMHLRWGHWLSPDPTGMMAVEIADPQSLNRYAYVQNNPLSFVDWLGLDCSCLVSLRDDVGSIQGPRRMVPSLLVAVRIAFVLRTPARVHLRVR
jgi:hypothetical protein